MDRSHAECICRPPSHLGGALDHSRERLQDDVRLDATLAQLLGDHEAEIAIGDHDRACEQLAVQNPRKHLLKRGLLADEAHELLRHALSRDRPQPRSGAAAHDDRHDFEPALV